MPMIGAVILARLGREEGSKKFSDQRVLVCLGFSWF